LFKIYIRFLIRIFKTVAVGRFCRVYQKRIVTHCGKTLVYLLTRFSDNCVIGYMRKRKVGILMLKSTSINS